MDVVLWIGPRHGPPELRDLLAAHGTTLQSYASVDDALEGSRGVSVAVAIVNADWAESSASIERLTSERPDIQVLVATDAGIPRSAVLALWSGASGILEFRSQTKAEIVFQVQEWVGRHRHVVREHELLLRLHALNEEFLRTIVAVEKRNLELEAKQAPEAAAAPAAEGPMRILVVDDEQAVNTMLTAVLSKAGFPVISVKDGEAAVQALAQEHFHLVITDKNLPGMSGLDVLREVRTQHPDTDVMLMTAYASMESAIDAVNLGAAGYLQKPFDHIRGVVEKVNAVLDKQRERLRKRQYLHVIKERNREFLEKYRSIRADLETVLQHRGVELPPGKPALLELTTQRSPPRS